MEGNERCDSLCRIRNFFNPILAIIICVFKPCGDEDKHCKDGSNLAQKESNVAENP